MHQRFPDCAGAYSGYETGERRVCCRCSCRAWKESHGLSRLSDRTLRHGGRAASATLELLESGDHADLRRHLDRCCRSWLFGPAQPSSLRRIDVSERRCRLSISPSRPASTICLISAISFNSASAAVQVAGGANTSVNAAKTLSSQGRLFRFDQVPRDLSNQGCGRVRISPSARLRALLPKPSRACRSAPRACNAVNSSSRWNNAAYMAAV